MVKSSMIAVSLYFCVFGFWCRKTQGSILRLHPLKIRLWGPNDGHKTSQTSWSRHSGNRKCHSLVPRGCEMFNLSTATLPTSYPIKTPGWSQAPNRVDPGPDKSSQSCRPSSCSTAKVLTHSPKEAVLFNLRFSYIFNHRTWLTY